MAEKTIEACFVEAWSAAQNPDMDGMNPHFKNRYATLKATLAAVRSACVPHGIAYIQALRESEGGYRLESCVIRADGARMILSQYPVEASANPQAFGSELTYKKRQQAQADWGIVGDEDEDGEAAAAAQSRRAGGNARKAETAATTASGGAKRQTANKYGKLKQLKAQALEIGISEDGMNGAIANVLQGKPMKDATDVEIKACETCLATLIADKQELLGKENNVNQ